MFVIVQPICLRCHEPFQYYVEVNNLIFFCLELTFLSKESLSKEKNKNRQDNPEKC